MHNVVIFASGRGSNAQAIIDHFKINNTAHVTLIVSNKADAGVIDIANSERIPFLIVDKKTFNEELLIAQIQEHNPALIILAGFLWKIPEKIIKAFPEKIINIHPALLPGYGGKGMYGEKVHNAVLLANERESGITIHYVNEIYDKGDIILQARCHVEKNDTADILAARIHKLEHFFYPRTIEHLLSSLT